MKKKVNPKALKGDHTHTLRGGSWLYEGHRCKSACRDEFDPDFLNLHIGFRLQIEKKEKNEKKK